MVPDAVIALLAEQDGVIARRQCIARGMTASDIARLVRRREWAQVHPGTYVDHTGPLTWNQRAWAAVLHAGRSALCGPSALRIAEGPGGRRASEQVIHVAVDRHRKVVAPPGVQVHRMADLHSRALWNLGPPRLRYEQAALDVALETDHPFDALAVLAGVCQARRTTARRLAEALAGRPRVPRRAWLADVLGDVAEGTCSVLEHAYLTEVERAHGLPRGGQQVRAVASTGVVYRDVDYPELIVELDGRLFHDTAEQRDRDFERDLDAAVDGRTTVRLGYGQVVGRPCSTARKVAALLAVRGWPGSPVRCGPACDVLSAPAMRIVR
jgi:hypothetical protein